MSSKVKQMMTEGHSKIEKKPKKRSTPLKDAVPDEANIPAKEAGPPQEVIEGDDFLARGISREKNECLNLVLKSDLTKRELATFIGLSDREREILPLIKTQGRDVLNQVYHLLKEQEPVLTYKIHALSFVSRVGHHKIIGKILNYISIVVSYIQGIKKMIELMRS